jgi:RNA polymerase sigma factor (sigma-70 family)
MPAGIDRDDVLGDAAVILVAAIANYNPTRGFPLKGWIGIKIRNGLFDRRRAATGFYRVPGSRHLVHWGADAAVLDLAVDHSAQAPIKAVDLHDEAEALMDLDQHRHQGARAYYLEGLEVPEIAKRIGKSTQTVYWQMSEAVKHIKEGLAARASAQAP